MANFLTDGRRALLDALKNDSEIAARVQKWFEFGAGLRERFNVRPVDCPFLAMYPTTGALEEPYNVAKEVPQDLEIVVGTDGQNVEPIEELTSLIVDRIHASQQSCLGLANDGLKNITIPAMRWEAWEDEKAVRIIWQAMITVRLTWIRHFG